MEFTELSGIDFFITAILFFFLGREVYIYIYICATVTSLQDCAVVGLCKRGIVRGNKRGRSKLIPHFKAPTFLIVTLFALFFIHYNGVIRMVKI